MAKFSARHVQVLVCSLICSVVGLAASADSRLPPSNPGAAVRLGVLDTVRPSPILSSQLLPCLGYGVVINVHNRYYRTAYFRFRLALQNSELRVDMIEEPPQTLWFNLLDRNLNLIKQYKGGVNEQIRNSSLAPGEYYIQVLTRGDTRHLPDGTNRGFVVSRAAPEGYRRAIEVVPTNLGTLSSGQTISHPGSVVIRRKRNISFRSTPANPHCPLGNGADGVTAHLYNEYLLQAAAGIINVSIRIASQQNWPSQYPFGIYYLKRGNLGSSWLPVRNGRINHPGGELRLRLGYFQGPMILARDAYVDYTLDVGASRSLATRPPGNPSVIQLGPPLQPNRVIIGPIRR